MVVALTPDGIDVDAERAGQVRAHRVAVRSDLGALENENAVGVDDAPSALAGERADRAPAAPSSRRRETPGRCRETAADVALAKRPEHRVGQRVGEYVGVGVAEQPAIVLDLDTAEHEPATLGERVHVVAQPDAHHADSPPSRRPQHRLDQREVLSDRHLDVVARSFNQYDAAAARSTSDESSVPRNPSSVAARRPPGEPAARKICGV